MRHAIVVCSRIALPHRRRNGKEQAKEDVCPYLHGVEPLGAILCPLASELAFWGRGQIVDDAELSSEPGHR